MSSLKRAPKARKWLRSDRFVNREYSWLQFNSRVLEEAARPDYPLLERLKFLAIFESNLDEFYMVRVSGLMEQQESNLYEMSPDGLGPSEQLSLIGRTVPQMRRHASAILHEDLLPALRSHGVEILSYAEISDKRKREMDAHFRKNIFPLCTPLVLHPSSSIPFISNRSLNIAVQLVDEQDNQKLARVKVPTVLPRLIRLGARGHSYVLTEDVIRNNLGALFPGVDIVSSHMFRVIRDADVEIRELEADDLLEIVELTIKRRRFGDPVMLEVSSDTPLGVREQLLSMLDLGSEDVIEETGLIGLEALWELASIDKPELRFPRHQPYLAETLSNPRLIFETLESTDILVQHPFDSFWPVEHFVRSAAIDPDVIGIKMTLYRVGTPSPIVESLLAAAEAGKQVAVMVELKARFDESNNLVWARALERAGVHVTYGFADLKTHCKLCLIVRKSPSGIVTYAHIGTGNYNPTTALIYTDLGLFTADEEITQDVAELFNVLTGFSRQREYRKLVVAPAGLRDSIIQRIRREARHPKGRIILKLNSLVDPDVINALYEASEAGVEIDLIIRGICTLRPGIEELSKNIRVVSIVGRFLEHSRVLYFENGGHPEVLIGSADMMRRNLDRRIEVLVPVTRPHLIAHLRDQVLAKYLADDKNAWDMQPDGSYVRRTPGVKPLSAQEYLIEHPTTKLLYPNESES
ncbi:MAG TPA: polyphosphate kinase 1 [Fimbriimonadaceae bacterium]|nr:polyphosphate kinase 1 [Fimbriimonadaceae bacterium]